MARDHRRICGRVSGQGAGDELGGLPGPGGGGARLVPQKEQKRESSRLARPQLGQTPGGGGGAAWGGIETDSWEADDPPKPPGSGGLASQTRQWAAPARAIRTAKRREIQRKRPAYTSGPE